VKAVARIKSSRRASAITVAVLIALVAAAAWFLVVAPKQSDASKVKDQVADASTQLATATQEAASANKAAAAAAEKALPADPDQPGILDQLNRIGKNSGVVVTTVAPNTSALVPSVVSLNVTVAGNYFQIESFLKKLRNQVQVKKNGHVEATGRLYDVQSVNVSTSGSSNQLSAVMSLTAGVYAPPAPEPVAPTTASAAGAGSTN
jgi:Tfp pilus assembly protein PilO